eukprot:scaffold227661_cov31-Tisochrysis_lutea.AAC.3
MHAFVACACAGLSWHAGGLLDPAPTPTREVCLGMSAPLTAHARRQNMSVTVGPRQSGEVSALSARRG